MFGVSISPPQGSIAEKPMSSSTMYAFGAPSGATGLHVGLPVRNRVPVVYVDRALKRLLIVAPLVVGQCGTTADGMA